MSADVHALAGAYVLDAVDDLERAAFERHLRDCEVCRADVDELREVTARLAAAAWSVPPPGLRTGVLAAIRTTRQLPPAVPTRAVPTRAVPTRAVPTRTRRLVAAAAAVLIALGGVFAVQELRVRAARGLVTASDLRTGQQVVAGGGRVTVVFSRERGSGLIMLAADTPPGGGRVYQLWTVRSGVPVSAGVLPVGPTTAVVAVQGLDRASDVGVTVEPAGGSRTPTLPMVADLKLS